jgi:perosamine synthetase
LQAIDGVEPAAIAPQTRRMSWFVYVARLAEDIDREALCGDLEAEGIPSRAYFPPIHLQPFYRRQFGYRGGEFPLSESIARRTLALPFFTRLTLEQVDYVCDALRAAVDKQRR